MKNVKIIFALLTICLVSCKRDYKCELYEDGVVVDVAYVNDLNKIEANSESAVCAFMGGVWSKK